MRALFTHRHPRPLVNCLCVPLFLACSAAMSSLSRISLFLILAGFLGGASAHNITAILASHRDLSQFNAYLTQTGLADEINARQTITVLVLNNTAMTSFVRNRPLSVIKSALSLLVLLDYFDYAKLKNIVDTNTTTLYQTTGKATGSSGMLHIVPLRHGQFGFQSSVPGSKLDSYYLHAVEHSPTDISVLEITAPIIVQDVLTSPSPSELNLTNLLEKHGCMVFADLLQSSGVEKTYELQMNHSLTVFAPRDDAFKALNGIVLNNLSKADIVSLLEYQAIPSYTPAASLKTIRASIPTLASNGARKFDLKVGTVGDDVVLKTGVNSSRIVDTVIDSPPLIIFVVDSVLLPPELVGVSSPAPSPVPISAPILPPAPTPAIETPSPLPSSPPAPPPAEAPLEAPVEAPADFDNGTVSGRGTVSSLLAALVVSCFSIVF